MGAEAVETSGAAPHRTVDPSHPSGSGYQHRRTAGEVHRCKKAHRTDISPEDWGKYGYAKKGDSITQAPIAFDGKQTLEIPRVRRQDITVEEFFERYALPRRPCIIEGAIDDWPAMQLWDIGQLMQRYAQASFKVGEDDRGRKLRMKLKYFVDYMEKQQDDSPLYLFETKVEGDHAMRKLLDDFQVPDLFPHDFFNLVNSQSKPPFRWWSIGPKRSGTTVHNDPLGTAAWNAVTHGQKRWVIFEPHVPARVAKGKDVLNKSTEDDEAIMYFDFLLPRLKAKHPEVRVFEGMQYAGDVIFVPGNWWHGVINTEDTVAVTQNYCGYDNFDEVWRRTRKERKKLAFLWLRNMRKFAPQLHRRAVELNGKDGYLMRHERREGDESSSSGSSSSSSESSSDSSSDAEPDLDLWGPQPQVNIQPPWLRGSMTATKATPSAPAPIALADCVAGVPNDIMAPSVVGVEDSTGRPCALPRKRPHGWTSPSEEPAFPAAA